MTYQPIWLGSTAGLTDEEFSIMRLHGADGSVFPFAIGGSDIATLYNVSPWRTPLDLYYEKMEYKKTVVVEHNKEAKDLGHKMETYYLEMFAQKTGLIVRGNDDQFVHPLYPHCVATPDGFIFNKSGVMFAVYEGKTTDSDNFEVIKGWKDGYCPYYYELQTRFYMGVMNLDLAAINCGWGLKPKDCNHVWIERDKFIETAIFEDAEIFVENCKRGIRPSLTGAKNLKLVIRSLNEIYGIPSKNTAVHQFDSAYLTLFKEILANQEKLKEVDGEIKKLTAVKKEIESTIDGLYIPLLDDMKNTGKGVVRHKNESYSITYEYPERMSVDTEMLKTAYPEVYKDVYRKTPAKTPKIIVKKEENA